MKDEEEERKKSDGVFSLLDSIDVVVVVDLDDLLHSVLTVTISFPIQYPSLAQAPPSAAAKGKAPATAAAAAAATKATPSAAAAAKKQPAPTPAAAAKPKAAASKPTAASKGKGKLAAAAAGKKKGAAASSAAAVTVKKVYDLPGQIRDTPDESDPTRKFYASLLEQRPDSAMALKYCVQSGLCPREQAEKWVKKNAAARAAAAGGGGGARSPAKKGGGGGGGGKAKPAAAAAKRLGRVVPFRRTLAGRADSQMAAAPGRGAHARARGGTLGPAGSGGDGGDDKANDKRWTMRQTTQLRVALAPIAHAAQIKQCL